MSSQKWIALSYTLSAKKKSSKRVAIWRRLRRLGAISPAGGLHILPATDASVEAFQWLAQEVQQAEGQAVVMHLDYFDGLDDQAVIERFNTARRTDYGEVEDQATELESRLKEEPDEAEIATAQDELAKLKRRYAEILTIDYFGSYEGKTTGALLDKVAKMVQPELFEPIDIPTVEVKAYQGRTWVTRPQPHVDRLSSIWFIRRYIDPAATILYATQIGPGQVGFDMPQAEFSHIGNLCTFETLIKRFQIEEPGLEKLAEIVHEIDLRDERFVHPEAIGVDAILRGWLHQNLTDQELETRGIALFDGLLASLAAREE